MASTRSSTCHRRWSRGPALDRAGLDAPQAAGRACTGESASPPAPTIASWRWFISARWGWTPEQADKILAGPNQYRMAQIAPPQVEGQRRAGPGQHGPAATGIPVAPAPSGEARAVTNGTPAESRRDAIKPDEPAWRQTRVFPRREQVHALRWKSNNRHAVFGHRCQCLSVAVGLDASMREVQISDPDAINDWERRCQSRLDRDAGSRRAADRHAAPRPTADPLRAGRSIG